MAYRTKLYSLQDESNKPKWVGPIDADPGESYSKLRFRLEEWTVFQWKFDFWDDEEKCRLNQVLERLNTIQDTVYVIKSEDEEPPCKRQRLPEDVVLDSIEGLVDGLGNEKPPNSSLGEHIVDLVGSSEIGARIGDGESGGEVNVKSTLVPLEIMNKYQRGEEKLRKELGLISLEDHMWCLKSWDKDGVGVVKLFCEECGKDCGGSSGDHSKITINNLFSNFRKNHLLSNQHVRNWCRRKGVNFSDHPQSLSTKTRPIVMTISDHKKAVCDGLQILQMVNREVVDGGGKEPFHHVGDPNADDLKSFWYKVRCHFCGDLLQLCPPKKNLEANLRNHLGGTKHAMAEDGST
jgi:hypothetical protein